MPKFSGFSVGIAVFICWAKVVGPQMHVVESLIGLFLGSAAGIWTWWHFHNWLRERPKKA